MYSHKAHYIWVGNNPLPQYAISNIIHFKANNSHYSVWLWTTNPHRLTSQILNSGYSTRFTSLIHCRNLPAMPEYVQSAVDREMSDSSYNNYAAASDILRLVILEKFAVFIWMWMSWYQARWAPFIRKWQASQSPLTRCSIVRIRRRNTGYPMRW